MSDSGQPSDQPRGILTGRLILSMVETEEGAHIEIDESEATGMSPLEMLGLLELAKVTVYDFVIESQYANGHLDEDEFGGQDDAQDYG